jgi:hypothetical protein
MAWRTCSCYPDGTDAAPFKWLKRRSFSDFQVTAQSLGEFALWVGNCCNWCNESAEVRFVGQSVRAFDIRGSDVDWENFDVSDPRFRRASAQEVAALLADATASPHVFCIAPRFGVDVESLLIFVACADGRVSRVPMASPQNDVEQ